MFVPLCFSLSSWHSWSASPAPACCRLLKMRVVDEELHRQWKCSCGFILGSQLCPSPRDLFWKHDAVLKGERSIWVKYPLLIFKSPSFCGHGYTVQPNGHFVFQQILSCASSSSLKLVTLLQPLGPCQDPHHLPTSLCPGYQCCLASWQFPGSLGSG